MPLPQKPRDGAVEVRTITGGGGQFRISSMSPYPGMMVLIEAPAGASGGGWWVEAGAARDIAMALLDAVAAAEEASALDDAKKGGS